MRLTNRVISWFTLIFILIMPQAIRAQGNITIQIASPTEGAQITGPFVLQGTTTVPPEKQLSLRVIATSTNEILVTQAIPTVGEVGQLGTFSFPINYVVTAATPALIQVYYAPAQSTTIQAKTEVRVVLRPFAATPVPSGDAAAFAAVQLALSEYEARIQTLTPIPVSVEAHTFDTDCLGLPRGTENCIAGQVDGQIVKLAYGGATYIYHVGNSQARFSETESGSIPQQGTIKAPKLLIEASQSTGIKLYVPVGLSGPFTGLYFSRVDWANGQVSIVYSAQGNPVDIQIVESAGNAQPSANAPNGETVQIAGLTRQVETGNGRKSVSWVIQGTVVKISVPDSIGTSDLAALASSFSVLGSSQPGQTSSYDRKQFGKLTMNLPEPMRSVEMAREAFMDLVRLQRQGAIISVQNRQFTDNCLQLPRQGESCTGGATPGYVIGIADSELYRYHVAGGTIRLNRDNSELVNKLGTDYVSVDPLRGTVPYGVAVPVDATLLGAQTSTINNVLTALLIYRDNQTNAVFALTESDQGVLPAASDQDQKITVKGVDVPIKNAGIGLVAVFVFTRDGKKPTLVSFWADPALGVDGLNRIANALTATG